MAKDEKTTPEAETDAWIPENVGDSLSGVVTDLDVAWSDFRANNNKSDPQGGNYPLISVKDADGKVWKVHAFRTVLFNEVMKRQPKPGETIVVTFTGYGKDNGKGNRAHLYRVETPGRDPEITARNVYAQVPNAAPAVPESDVPADTEGLQEEIPF